MKNENVEEKIKPTGAVPRNHIVMPVKILDLPKCWIKSDSHILLLLLVFLRVFHPFILYLSVANSPWISSHCPLQTRALVWAAETRLFSLRACCKYFLQSKSRASRAPSNLWDAHQSAGWGRWVKWERVSCTSPPLRVVFVRRRASWFNCCEQRLHRIAWNNPTRPQHLKARLWLFKAEITQFVAATMRS